MRAFARVVLMVLAIIFLAPTAVLYVTGMATSIFLSFKAPVFLVLFCLLLIPGWGLYAALRMLLFTLKNLNLSLRTEAQSVASITESFQALPNYIWAGLAVGVVCSLLITVPFIAPGSDSGDMNALLIYGGPLVLVVFLVIVYAISKRTNTP